MIGSLTDRPSLTIKRTFNASPERVYSAWTEPDQLAKWMGPGETTCSKCEADVRAGGAYRIEMLGADGEQHVVLGEYEEVIPNEKLVFTWHWISTPDRVSKVTITFKPHGSGTAMTLHHAQFADEDARDRHNSGWTGCLANLSALLDSGNVK